MARVLYGPHLRLPPHGHVRRVPGGVGEQIFRDQLPPRQPRPTTVSKRELAAHPTVEKLKIGNRPSGEGDRSAPLIQRALATTAVFGVQGQFARSSTDSNVPIALGVAAVTIGRGGIGFGGHSPDEYWVNVDGHLAIQRALLLLVAEAGLAEVIPQAAGCRPRRTNRHSLSCLRALGRPASSSPSVKSCRSSRSSSRARSVSTSSRRRLAS